MKDSFKTNNWLEIVQEFCIHLFHGNLLHYVKYPIQKNSSKGCLRISYEISYKAQGFQPLWPTFSI